MRLRGKKLRTTFLVRFTLVTFASAGVAAILLAFTLDMLHRHSIERDATVAALGRIDARLAAPLARYSRGGRLDPEVQAQIAAAAADATLDPFVSGLLIFDDTGRPVLGTAAAGELEAIRRAAASDTFVSVDRRSIRTVLQPFATGHSRFVVAVDFAHAQMEAQLRAKLAAPPPPPAAWPSSPRSLRSPPLPQSTPPS